VFCCFAVLNKKATLSSGFKFALMAKQTQTNGILKI